ncbi:30S ribosomal protein S8 [Candidatus Woesebacteria bacterium]|nr:30S ribosomal protein S8 [Candidatus Woesebacteria bacterium]
MIRKKIQSQTQKREAKQIVKRAHVNYPVGDFLIRVKNAALSGKSEVVLPKTKLIAAVAKVLKETGFLSKVESHGNEIHVTIARYAKESALMGISLVSRPGLRQYFTAAELARVRGPEIYILSTSQGVLSSSAALKKGIGGEIIAKVW